MPTPQSTEPTLAKASVPGRRRLLVEWALLLFAATGMMGGLSWTQATTRIDNAIYDAASQLRTMPAPSDIVIVAVDAPSIAKLGAWPWSRQVQATLLQNIVKDAPKTVAYEVVLPTSTGADQDMAIRNAIRGHHVYLPEVIKTEGNATDPGTLLSPLPAFASVSAGVGTVAPDPDDDGIVRQTVLLTRLNGKPLPNLLSLMAARETSASQGKHNEWASMIPGWLIERDRALIPFARPQNRFQTVSAADLVAGQVPKALLTNKYIIMGATAPGMSDNFATPGAGREGMPNAEITANILDAGLNHTLIGEMTPGAKLALSAILVWSMFGGILVTKPGRMTLLVHVASFTILGASVIGLLFLGVWFPPSAVILTRTLVQIVWSARRLQAASNYFAQELAQLQIRAGGAAPLETKIGGITIGDSVARQMLLIEQTKSRIRNLRSFVNDVMASFPDPVFVVSARGRIIVANESAIALGGKIGLPTEAGNPIQDILAALESAAGGKERLWPPNPEGGSAPRGVAPGGHIMEARYTASGYDGDKAKGWTLQLVDVTNLVSTMRQREEILQLFTHDMRSPQSAILAALKHRDFQDAPANLRESIRRNAQRTIDLADGFVRLAKAEASEYVMEEIDLFHLLGDAVDAVWPIAQAAGVEVTVEYTEQEFVVNADRGLLARALVNLLDNAIKFSPAGKAVVCALKETTLNGQPAVACSIADEANGMSIDKRKTLFKRFARTAAGGDDDDGKPLLSNSIGLGLSMVHTVVTRHNGLIECDSEVGRGTTFTITMPLHGAAKDPVDAANAGVKAAGMADALELALID